MADTTENIDVLDSKTVISEERALMSDLIEELDNNINLLIEKKERLEIVLGHLGEAVENQMDLDLSDST